MMTGRGKWEKEHHLIFCGYNLKKTDSCFVKEAELVLSCFHLRLKVLLKLWSNLGEKFTGRSDCRF